MYSLPQAPFQGSSICTVILVVLPVIIRDESFHPSLSVLYVFGNF